MKPSKFFPGLNGVKLLVGMCLAIALFAYAGGPDVIAMAKLHPMLTVVILLACLNILAGVTALRLDPSPGKVYVAGLIATAPLLPGAAILFTVVICLTAPTEAKTADKLAPFWGSLIAVEAWVGMAYVCRGFAKAENAVPSSYAELCLRLDQLKTELVGFKSGG